MTSENLIPAHAQNITREKRCEQFYPEVKSCLGVKIIRPGSHSGPSCSKLG